MTPTTSEVILRIKTFTIEFKVSAKIVWISATPSEYTVGGAEIIAVAMAMPAVMQITAQMMEFLMSAIRAPSMKLMVKNKGME